MQLIMRRRGSSVDGCKGPHAALAHSQSAGGGVAVVGGAGDGSPIPNDSSAGSSSSSSRQVPYREHTWSLAELQMRVGITLDETNPDKSTGLTTAEAEGRLRLHGRNELTPPRVKPEWRRLLEKFLDPFMILLEIAAILSIVLYAIPPHGQSNLYVAVVLAGIIVLTCLMSYYQEGQSAKLMNSFASMMSASAQVIRDGGSTQRIPTAEVVLGDVVVLESGERVPADMRIIYSDGIKVDNSSFTGESLPVELKADGTDEEEALHAHNIAFNSALVVEGRGVGVVVRTGDRTMIGRIAHLVSSQDGVSKKSTLEVEVLRFVHFITFLAVATGVAFYAVAVARGGDPLSMFITCCVVIVIANVPEGLPATVTSCLTVSARRLASRQVFVKRLDVIETLGSTSVVASDKTGTLTQNKMTVSHIFIDGRLRTADQLRHDMNWRSDPTFLDLLSASALCNMAKFEDTPTGLLVPITSAIVTTLDATSSQQYHRSRRGLSRSGSRVTSDTHMHHPSSSISGSVTSILQRDFFEPSATTTTKALTPQRPKALLINIEDDEDDEKKTKRGDDEQAAAMEAGGVVRAGSGGGGGEEEGDIPIRKIAAFLGQASFSGILDRQAPIIIPPTLQSTDQQHARSGGSLSVSGPGAARYRTTTDAASLASYSTWGAHTRAVSHVMEVPARKVVGNSSDVGIFNFCHGFVNVEDLRNRREQVYHIPFNSRNKWMMSIHRTQSSTTLTSYLKGAPEIVLDRCTTYMGKGGKESLIDDAFTTRFREMYEEVAGKGERVLAMATQRLDTRQWPINMTRAGFKEREEDLPREGYTFIGLVSLVDPPKHGVAEAVLRCKEAGIKVVMITGDHPLTAEAIARKVNIIHEYNTKEEIAREEGKAPQDIADAIVGAQVVYCKDLHDYDADAWACLLAKPELVFARASPHDKLVIVEKLKARGEVVAVTGDGVNDSPALKKADVGIAMGVMGSEVAKNAANVILMDDDFSSIVNGIEEGRVLFDNLSKTIAYTLTHALPELVAVVISVIFTAPVGLTSLMILSIDLLTEICPSISFAWEPPESSVMRRPPRVIHTDRLVRPSLLLYSYLQSGLVESIACLSAYLLVFHYNHVPLSSIPNFGANPGTTIITNAGRAFTYPEQQTLASMAATAYYVTLILSQALHVFSVKTRLVSLWEHGPFCNVTMNFGVLAALGIMCFITFVPGVDVVFGTYPRLAATYFCLPALVAGTFLLLWSEVRKAILRSLIHKPTATFARVFAW